MSAGFHARRWRRDCDDGGPLFRRRSQDPEIPHQMETRRGHQGRELLDQFAIAYDHVRRAVAPGCFHPIREAAAGKTLPDARRTVEVSTYSGTDSPALLADGPASSHSHER